MVTALCSQQRAFGDHPVTVLSRLQAGNVASSTHFWIFAYDLKAFPRFWIHGSTHFWILAYDLKAFPRFWTHGPSLVHNSVLLGIIRSLDRVGYKREMSVFRVFRFIFGFSSMICMRFRVFRLTDRRSFATACVWTAAREVGCDCVQTFGYAVLQSGSG